jgi:UDP-glucose 4-epimerase
LALQILITGISGLIGSAVSNKLLQKGMEVLGLDVLSSNKSFIGDTRNETQVDKFVQNCDGILHLAAVSRVIWAQQDPKACWTTNVEGTRNVLKAAIASPKKPWIIFGSSREVYGQQELFPVAEDAGLRPMNIYGHAKVMSEQEMIYARTLGIKTAIARFSNVFGSIEDHATRVVPAFCRGALENKTLIIEGEHHVFDFTYIHDVADGIVKLVDFITEEKKADIPTIHFVGGQGTTLGQLSQLICSQAQSKSAIKIGASRNFDVARFIGNPQRALELLGWKAETSVQQGVQNLLADFKEKLLKQDNAA